MVEIAPSTWQCNGTSDRNQICEFTNFCVDRYHGPFIISDVKPPSVNLINTGSDEDIWFSPNYIPHGKLGKYVNKKLMVYGLYSPFHFSHYIYNGLMPLYSTLLEYKVQDTWLLRAATYWNEHTVIDRSILSKYREIVLDSKDKTDANQIMPPYRPICFDKAIVGTGNRCSLWYCENSITKYDYNNFKQEVLDQPLDQSPCLNLIQTYNNSNNPKLKIGLLNRQFSRHITNMPEVIYNLLHNIPDVHITLFNFDKGCSIRSTAHLMSDLDVLISPFGNGLGSGIFMKENSIIISIDSRWYNESWFYWPMTTLGVRLYTFKCSTSSCQEYDSNLLTKILSAHNVQLSSLDMLEIMSAEYPYSVLTNYLPDHEWEVVDGYRKDVSRRVNIIDFIPFIQNSLNSNYTYYIQQCRLDNLCLEALNRNGG